MDVHHGWHTTRNRAVYMKPSVACGWAGVVMCWSGAVGGAEYTTDSVMLNRAEVMHPQALLRPLGPFKALAVGQGWWWGAVYMTASLTYNWAGAVMQKPLAKHRKSKCRTNQPTDQPTNIVTYRVALQVTRNNQGSSDWGCREAT